MHGLSLDCDFVSLSTNDAFLELTEIDDLLDTMAEIDPMLAQIVELKFFSGLSLAEVGDTLGVSSRTVSRAWKFAQTWLKTELN